MFVLLSGRPGDVGGDDIGGVSVQRGAGPVVAHGGVRVGVRGGLLHVAQRDSGVKRGSYKSMSQRVGADALGDPGLPGDAADDPPGTMPVEPVPVDGHEDRAFGALTDGQVDSPCGARRERDGYDLAALSGDDQGAVPALEPEGLDVRARGLRHPQPIERQQ
jgi:hypothetical protein